MLEQNRADKLLADRITQERQQENYNPYPNGWNIDDFMIDVLKDRWQTGFVMQYPHGKVIHQAQSSYYYRGENQIFQASCSSLYRQMKRPISFKRHEVEHFVAYLRILMFRELLFRFEHVQQFVGQGLVLDGHYLGEMDLLYVAIAQHYGLDTALLDVTSDVETALFFSCCTTTDKPNEWRPLCNEDFRRSEKNKFGVLFRRSSDHPVNWLPYAYDVAMILPVGFQPFMRCHMQYGYVAIMNPYLSLQKEPSFEHFFFRHDECFCKDIFELMDCGKRIYPQEGLNILHNEISEIRTLMSFPREVFEFACEEMRMDDKQKGEMLFRLNICGYSTDGAYIAIPDWKVSEIDKKYSITASNVTSDRIGDKKGTA